MNCTLMLNSGIILIDKQAGISTRKEERKLKDLFSTKKVGHAGTLDPFATGLIICGINKGTKLLNELEDKDKTYLASLFLGTMTDTGDKDGTIIKTQEPHQHTKEEIENTLKSFLGESSQVPPMYSALKKDGVPLYKLARENINVEREPRKIKISSIELIDYKDNIITFKVHVSKGTYIRTLGEDIAKKLNEIGHLEELRRLSVGGFKIEQAHLITEVDPERDLISIRSFFKGIKEHELTKEEEERVRNGADIKLSYSESMILTIAQDGTGLALYTKADEGYYKVFKEFK